MTKIQYLLDSNIFIEASRKYYHFDICPDFWSVLIEQHINERVFSIEPVKAEILPKRKKVADNQNDDTSNHDTLSLWVENETPKNLFADCDNPVVLKSYKEIMQSVYANPQYFDIAKEKFAAVADSWVVAYAHANSLTVVSHENASPDSKKRVLLPVICNEFNVPVVTLFEMLLELNVKFVRK